MYLLIAFMKVRRIHTQTKMGLHTNHNITRHVIMGGESYYFKTTREKNQTAHWRKILIPGHMSCSLTEKNNKTFRHFDKWYIQMKKVEALKTQNTIRTSSFESVLLQELEVWCISQNRWHHGKRKLCRSIEVKSEYISQKVKAWVQMDLPDGQ